MIFFPLLHDCHSLSSAGPQSDPMNKSGNSSLKDLGGSLRVGVYVPFNIGGTYVASDYEINCIINL